MLNLDNLYRNPAIMPILRTLPDTGQPRPVDWIDPDTIARPVVAFGIDAAQAGRLELAPHRHAKAQFVLCLRGVMTCEAEGGFWVVPAHSALWIPGGMLHAVAVEGAMEGYAAFIDADHAAALPAHCCTYAATPLLRELLIRCAGFAPLYPEGGVEARVAALLLDEIGASPAGRFHLPVPQDARLRKIVDLMLHAPDERGTIASWAKRVGMSERTLSRMIASQAGMSFGRWRQQLHLMLALQKLAKGDAIGAVAADLGYESASSFVTMFRKALGEPPGRYLNKATQ